MTPLCPKCGREVIYITSPSVRENAVYTVNAAVKRLITKMGRVVEGYEEHICTRPKRMAEGADVEKDAENHTG